MSTVNTRYKLTFEYDGTDFSGWQIQPEVRTVEGVIEEALATIYQSPIDIIGQGRTDAGVHAINQTAHVDLPEKFDTEKVMHAMRGLLPGDVSLKNIDPVSNDFHARFDAVSREYLYKITMQPAPLIRNVTWYVYNKLDFKLLEQCAGLVIGEHDFINFCIPPDDEEMTTISTIIKSEWHSEGNLLVYRIEGNRFLRHMVRRLVGLMTDIASGKEDIDHLKNLLRYSPQIQKAPSAPARGLHLSCVRYD